MNSKQVSKSSSEAKQQLAFRIGTIGAIISLVGIMVPFWFMRKNLLFNRPITENIFYAWIVIMISMLILSGLIGWLITKRIDGILIDKYYSISLSHMQAFVWTIVILGGFLAAVFGNILARQANPLAIKIPGELWIVLGISSASLVGKDLILSGKATQTPDQSEHQQLDNIKQKENLGQQPEANGIVVNKRSADDARWIDMFTGDEVGNKVTVDLGKLQMFFFTIVLILSYSYSIGSQFFENRINTGFPPLDPSTVALFGISHAGYLANKAVTQTKIASPTP